MRVLPVLVRADFDLAATDLVRVLTVVPFEAAVADLFDLVDLAAECSIFLSIFLMPCLDRIFEDDDAWPLDALDRFAVDMDSIDAWASIADLFDLVDLAAECSIFLSIFLMPCLDRIFEDDDAWPLDALDRFAVDMDSIDASASPRRPDRCVIADLATILAASSARRKECIHSAR